MPGQGPAWASAMRKRVDGIRLQAISSDSMLGRDRFRLQASAFAACTRLSGRCADSSQSVSVGSRHSISRRLHASIHAPRTMRASRFPVKTAKRMARVFLRMQHAFPTTSASHRALRHPRDKMPLAPPPGEGGRDPVRLRNSGVARVEAAGRNPGWLPRLASQASPVRKAPEGAIHRPGHITRQPPFCTGASCCCPCACASCACRCSACPSA